MLSCFVCLHITVASEVIIALITREWYFKCVLLLLVPLHINAMFRVVITPPPLPLHIVNIFRIVITLAQHLFSVCPSQWRSEAELKAFHVEKQILKKNSSWQILFV